MELSGRQGLHPELPLDLGHASTISWKSHLSPLRCAHAKKVRDAKSDSGAGVLLVSLTAAACGGSGSSSATQPAGGVATTAPETPSLPVDGKPVPTDTSEFTTEIDNPYWPMEPGSQRVFRETDAEGAVSRVVVTVLDKTKVIANGVEARIVHDQVTEGDQITEDTYDWYAQDFDGNLRYFGEDTTEYENEKPKTKEGSWEAGVDGALPGIIMPASRQVRMTYREEHYKGHTRTARRSSRPTRSQGPVRTVRAWRPDAELQRHRARCDRGEDLRGRHRRRARDHGLGRLGPRRAPQLPRELAARGAP